MTLKKGSITVFLAFVLSLSAALICVQITSVKQAASRAQIAGALDIGLYSLFAQYDRDLLEEYDLFYLDGSFGNGLLNMGKVYDVMKMYIEPVLEQNFTELKLDGGGWTGYQLATDNGGDSFFRQAVQAERSLLAGQGIHLLMSEVQIQAAQLQNQDEMQNRQKREEILQQYDETITQSDSENSGVGSFENEESQGTGALSPEENPIEVIRQIQKMGILELVLEQPQKVSECTADLRSFLSRRSRNEGMPLRQSKEELSSSDGIFFQEYLLQKCGNYLTPGKGSLSYQVEYILFGKDSDVENLKKVVNRLLMLREGANLIYLYSDGVKRSQAAALASAIASAFLLPVAEPVIELAILSCWAFGESVLDVRELLSGGNVAIVKDASNWQLSLENLSHLLERLDSDRKNQKNGLCYQDYLRILLFMKGKEEKILRGMDMVECGVQAIEGKGDFRFDCCISAAEVSVDVYAGNQKTYTGVRAYTYEEN